MFPPIVVLR